jgi:DNA-binding transcriptional MocR family regulator
VAVRKHHFLSSRPVHLRMRAAIAIDSASSLPIHRQIYDAWRRGILSGRFRKGDRVPSSRELATALRVARSTVTQAYEQLFAEGYLRTARGSGTEERFPLRPTSCRSHLFLALVARCFALSTRAMAQAHLSAHART